MLWLHRYAKLVAASTVLLIAAGGMVTSTGSGLSVPDWPNTYGQFMFLFPMDRWVGGIFYEHSHRLIASTVGFLTIILAVWTWRVEPRRWVRNIAFAALGAVWWSSRPRAGATPRRRPRIFRCAAGRSRPPR
jgi:cytochrome c oxidase assembly protein subunit 15